MLLFDRAHYIDNSNISHTVMLQIPSEICLQIPNHYCTLPSSICHLTSDMVKFILLRMEKAFC